MNDVAIILINQGKYQQAQKLLEEVLDVKRRTLGPEDPITLRYGEQPGDRDGHAGRV